jgi:uncharacterized protein (TIGR00288 family)
MGEPNGKSIALLIDGPNMLISKEICFDLDVIIQGNIKRVREKKVGKVFLNRYSSDNL